MFKGYTNIRYPIVYLLEFSFGIFLLFYFLGNLILEIQVLFWATIIVILYLVILWIFFVNMHVFKVVWDEKRFEFKNFLWRQAL